MCENHKEKLNHQYEEEQQGKTCNNENITKQLPIIEFSVNKTYAYKMKEKGKPESANIRLIIQPDFDETGYKNIEEIKKDLQFIFEQANRYFD